MIIADCPKGVRYVGGVVIFIGGLFVTLCALTQSVGVNLGALVFIAMSMIWPGRAILRCENWGRIGYLITGPFAVWMSLQAQRDAEFFQDFLYLLTLTAGIVYLVAFVVLMRPTTRKAFLNPTTLNEGRSLGKGFSVLLISFAGFLFAWFWTNLSAALYIISRGNFLVILVHLGGISIAAAFGALVLRVWWSKSWGSIAGLILIATGFVLLEHALCYSAIMALEYLDRRDLGMGHVVGLIIGGRFLFGVLALAGGVIFVRSRS